MLGPQLYGVKPQGLDTSFVSIHRSSGLYKTPLILYNCLLQTQAAINRDYRHLTFAGLLLTKLSFCTIHARATPFTLFYIDSQSGICYYNSARYTVAYTTIPLKSICRLQPLHGYCNTKGLDFQVGAFFYAFLSVSSSASA